MKYLCLLYGNQKKVSSLSKEQFASLVEKCQYALQSPANIRRIRSVRLGRERAPLTGHDAAAGAHRAAANSLCNIRTS